jgi:hypothetical protein
MAGEPLLNSAELGVILIDEPAARAVRISGFEEACDMAHAIGAVAACPLLDLRARTESGCNLRSEPAPQIGLAWVLIGRVARFRWTEFRREGTRAMLTNLTCLAWM